MEDNEGRGRMMEEEPPILSVDCYGQPSSATSSRRPGHEHEEMRARKAGVTSEHRRLAFDHDILLRAKGTVSVDVPVYSSDAENPKCWGRIIEEIAPKPGSMDIDGSAITGAQVFRLSTGRKAKYPSCFGKWFIRCAQVGDDIHEFCQDGEYGDSWGRLVADKGDYFQLSTGRKAYKANEGLKWAVMQKREGDFRNLARAAEFNSFGCVTRAK